MKHLFLALAILIGAGLGFGRWPSPEPALLSILAPASGATNQHEIYLSEESTILKVAVEARPADWKRFGRAAGVLRNTAMLADRPELVIAFPGGKGTADMVRKAKAAGLEVIVVPSEA